ncbi:MAG: histidinol dehydrogenase [Nitrospirae bacterium RBG_13_39_12]|nr:MAG: histidinol dehydrogenase [Nitrospirae bacterium RBG_13_39_12]
MRVIESNREISAFLKILKNRASGIGHDIENRVKTILDDVRKNGDRAVLKYSRAFDLLKTKQLIMTQDEISKYSEKADPALIKALKFSAKRIKAFHEKQKEKSWSFPERNIITGQLIQPIERVGIYIPGGKASYPSTVLMNVIPAQVAGVKEIVLCVPTPEGKASPYVMASIKLLGVKEVYRIGGAQAVGAMAYGTETLKKVDKIVGPGNIYVATAKKMVFGEVDIDMIAGPSEILIIADNSAKPAFVAADLLSQAEHDEYASSILITDSRRLAENVYKELGRQLNELSRKKIAVKSINKYGAIIITKDINAALELSNLIAPEHLEVMTKKPTALLSRIRNAGAIFLGEWTPEVLGDYSAGPNHTLPTGGTSRFSSPLGVYDFVKRSSLLRFTKKGFKELAETSKIIASAEGLEAHRNSITVREGS